MRSDLRSYLLLPFVFALLPRAVFAQETEPAPAFEPTTESLEPAPAVGPNAERPTAEPVPGDAAENGSMDAEARARFQAGRIAYDAGRFESALNDFRRAYELSNRARLLYNIGQAADRLRRDDEAVEAFTLFLERSPEAEQAPAVRARLEVMLEARREREREDEQLPPSPQTVVQPSRTGPIVVGISGAVFAVAGAVLLGIGIADRNEIEGLQTPRPWDEIEGQVDRVPRLTGAGIGMLAVGGALAVTGLVWRLAQGSATEVSVGLGGAVVRGRF